MDFHFIVHRFSSSDNIRHEIFIPQYMYIQFNLLCCLEFLNFNTAWVMLFKIR